MPVYLRLVETRKVVQTIKRSTVKTWGNQALQRRPQAYKNLLR